MNHHSSARAVVVLSLVPIGLVAQPRRDMLPLRNWNAPVYWQPSQAEARTSTEQAKAAAAPSIFTSPMTFVAMTPCRVVDTRSSQNFPAPFGAPNLVAGQVRNFPIQSSTLCSIPSSAQAYSLNVTVVPPGSLGYLILWPEGQTQPNAVTLDDITGDIRNNAVIMPAGTSGGGISAVVNASTDLVIDINGYYAPLGAGPSHAYFANNFNDVTIGFASSGNLVTLSVPAGSYVIDATTHLVAAYSGQAQGDEADCSLHYNNNSGASAYMAPINSGSYGLTRLIQDTVTLLVPSTIVFSCYLDTGTYGDTDSAFDSSMRAVSVGAVN